MTGTAGDLAYRELARFGGLFLALLLPMCFPIPILG